MEKMIQFCALKAALNEYYRENDISVSDTFAENQAKIYVYDNVRDGKIADATLTIVASLKKL